jgi:hypothetical protein
VRDGYSRLLLAIALCLSTTEAVKAVLTTLFRRYGVPLRMQMDNGTPFISVRSPGGLSALSAWLMSLGITIVRSRLGSPQDNGAHERMHRDISREVEALPADDAAAQQRALDLWRQDFNHIRPHEALKGKTPQEVYKPKDKRPMAARQWRYPDGYEAATVILERQLPRGWPKLLPRYGLGLSRGGHSTLVADQVPRLVSRARPRFLGPRARSGRCSLRECAIDRVKIEIDAKTRGPRAVNRVPTKCQPCPVLRPPPATTPPMPLNVHDNILGAIGHTPLVRLNRITRSVRAKVFAKVETFNPGERKRNKPLFATKERRDVVARGPVRGADSPWRGGFGPGRTDLGTSASTACAHPRTRPRVAARGVGSRGEDGAVPFVLAVLWINS